MVNLYVYVCGHKYLYIYIYIVFPAFMSYSFVYIYRFIVMYNSRGVHVHSRVRTFVFGLGTDCCKNSRICTNEFKNINTQAWRGIGVCADREIDTHARVKVYS